MNLAEKKNQLANIQAIAYLTSEIRKLNDRIDKQNDQIHQLRFQMAEFEKQRTAEFVGRVGLGRTA